MIPAILHHAPKSTEEYLETLHYREVVAWRITRKISYPSGIRAKDKITEGFCTEAALTKYTEGKEKTIEHNGAWFAFLDDKALTDIRESGVYPVFSRRPFTALLSKKRVFREVHKFVHGVGALSIETGKWTPCPIKISDFDYYGRFKILDVVRLKKFLQGQADIGDVSVEPYGRTSFTWKPNEAAFLKLLREVGMDSLSTHSLNMAFHRADSLGLISTNLIKMLS